MQLTLHDEPLHVGTPFGGSKHAEHDAPQVLVDELLTQLPLQLCVPAPQTTVFE